MFKNLELYYGIQNDWDSVTVLIAIVDLFHSHLVYQQAFSYANSLKRCSLDGLNITHLLCSGLVSFITPPF